MYAPVSNPQRLVRALSVPQAMLCAGHPNGSWARVSCDVREAEDFGDLNDQS